MVVNKQDIKTFAIIGLLINLIIPGLGTIIAATKQKDYMNYGIIQLVLGLIGWPLLLLLIGFIILPAVWIWALVTSIMMITKN